MSLNEIINREWQSIWGNKRTMAILFLVPLLYITMFGAVYSHQKVTEVKAIVYDGDRTNFSRELVQNFDQSETFSIVGSVGSIEELKQQIIKGSAVAGIIIPERLSENISQGVRTSVMTVLDGSNMIYANAVTRSANEITQTISSGVALYKLESAGLTGKKGMDTLIPVSYGYRILFNPTFSYENFMLIGLVGTVIQQVLLMGLALAITREKEAGSWSNYSIFTHKPWIVAYGKCMPYFVISMMNLSVTTVLARVVFHVPFEGELMWLFVAGLAFNFALIGLGFLGSMVSASQLNATQILMLVALPSFILSGFTWPLEAMPRIMQWIGHLLPLTYFLHAFREICIKGNGIQTFASDLMVLVLTGVICFLAAFAVFPLTVSKRKQKVKAVSNLSREIIEQE